MQLLCLGDTAFVQPSFEQLRWPLPAGFQPGCDAKILLNWELPACAAVNPQPRTGGERLLSLPESPKVIENWSPGIATLATNHILDGGKNGLSSTIKVLNQSGFATLGAGETQEEIARTLFWETGVGRLALVNWVFPETHPDWMAIPGPNCWPGSDEAQRQIAELKKQADWVAVVVHWSDECFPYPSPIDRQVARHLAQAGTDLVIGHHPHVVRGMEAIGETQVFYSLGNYYFSNIPGHNDRWIARWAPRNREGLGIRFTFQHGQKPSYQPFSFWQTRNLSRLDPLGRAVRRMKLVSAPLSTLNDAQYTAWYKVRRARFDAWDYRWQFGVWKLNTRGLLLYPLRMLYTLAINRH